VPDAEQNPSTSRLGRRASALTDAIAARRDDEVGSCRAHTYSDDNTQLAGTLDQETLAPSGCGDHAMDGDPWVVWVSNQGSESCDALS
jgi:hypothetical protein